MTADPIKEALHRLPYGFYSITSRNGNEVNAMVGNWLTQVSFEPRLLLFALSKIAYTHEVVSAGGVGFDIACGNCAMRTDLVGEVVNALIFKEGNADTTLTLPDLKWNYAG